ncbi:dTMP kinase [Streptomyces sp. NPDC001380]|uniref:dTMP kinase n=1 Tax=Streptomyces sp. NPDC001380 TaxID=3364566 RepID=UPI0036BC4118
MLLALEGIAGAGKSTLRDRILAAAAAEGIPTGHIGQFSWLSLRATRAIVSLRSGKPAPEPEHASAAVRRDLELHARHNLVPALRRGPVVADRFVLSTACLLALLHGQPVEGYVEHVARTAPLRPALTVLLTTPPPVCCARLAARTARRRFTEDPPTAARLADLYDQAAAAWQRTTGLPVLLHPCTTGHDLALLTTACLDRLREAARTTPRTREPDHAPAPTAPRRLGP